MKPFDEWKKDIDEKVAMFDFEVQKKEAELSALKALRDSYALASYPLTIRHIEECGK
jgi:hypothetical protein